MESASILWRCLDRPGHDACRLSPLDTGWRLEGAAVFLHEGQPALLAYEIACDFSWHTRGGEIRGWIGAQALHVSIIRTNDSTWMLNGAIARGVEACVDLDLGFTPATNLPQLRRVALAPGQKAEVSVAWLDLPGSTLEPLTQTYERRAESLYWYEAPRFGYAAMLEVSPTGFVLRYPGLWQVP